MFINHTNLVPSNVSTISLIIVLLQDLNDKLVLLQQNRNFKPTCRSKIMNSQSVITQQTIITLKSSFLNQFQVLSVQEETNATSSCLWMTPLMVPHGP